MAKTVPPYIKHRYPTILKVLKKLYILNCGIEPIWTNDKTIPIVPKIIVEIPSKNKEKRVWHLDTYLEYPKHNNSVSVFGLIPFNVFIFFWDIDKQPDRKY